MTEPFPPARDDVSSTSEPEAPTLDGDPATHELQLRREFRFGKQLPLDVLSPETIARLQAGGELSPQELAIVQAAALQDAGIIGRLALAALSSEATSSSSSEPAVVRDPAAPADGTFVPLPESVRTFEWKWDGRAGQQTVEREPATYYEALTGRPDPARDTFITIRRVINWSVWSIALGLPLMIIGLAIATGQSLETIFYMGMGAFIVGIMFRRSFPRTPFD